MQNNNKKIIFLEYSSEKGICKEKLQKPVLKNIPGFILHPFWKK